MIAGQVAGAAEEGQRVWAFTVGGFVSASPAVTADSGTVYVGVEARTGGGRVFAVTRDGAQRWVTSPDFLGPVSSSPAIGADGTVYVGSSDGRLYALNPANGSVRWQFNVRAFVTSSPAIGADGTIYFGAGDGRLYAVSAAGGLVWSVQTDNVIESSPAIGPDGTIYVGSYDRNVYAIAPNGVERWRYPTGGIIYGSPALARNGTIYVGSADQRLHAIAPDGTRRWDFGTNGDIQSSPVLGADGTVYFASTDLHFYAVAPDGTLRWRTFLNTTTASTAAVRADGVIIVGADDGVVRALNPDNGAVRWSFDTRTGPGNLIESSPIVAPDGSIYVGSLDGLFYKIAGNGSPLSTHSSWPAFRRDIAHNGRAEPAAGGQLLNLATRAQVPAGDTVVVGFVVEGEGAKAYLMRAIGPTLAQFGIANFLSDPRMDLYSGPQLVTSNDNWGDAPPGLGVVDTAERVGAFPLAADSKDAVLLLPLQSGLYSARVNNVENRAGVVLVEAYDAIGGDPAARLVNLSTLGPVGSTRENYLVAGIAVGGTGRTRVLVRGVGPSLAQFGVSPVLARPVMSVYTATTPPQLIRTNSGWTAEGLRGDLAGAARSVAAFPLTENSADAAVLLSLQPGNYTVEISGVGGTTGQALVEVYVLP